MRKRREKPLTPPETSGKRRRVNTRQLCVIEADLQVCVCVCVSVRGAWCLYLFVCVCDSLSKVPPAPVPLCDSFPEESPSGPTPGRLPLNNDGSAHQLAPVTVATLSS